MVATKNKFIPFDYEAMEALTSSAFVKKIKLECDSENHGFASTIERFNIEYPSVNSNYRIYSVTIVSRERFMSGRGRGSLRCHFFQHDPSDPERPLYRGVPYFVFGKFKKICVGIKDE
jgi:hypothetical protein